MNVPIFILLGSNIGDRLSNLTHAIHEIGRLIGEVITISSVYKSSAWGNTKQPDFYNQVIEINSPFDPESLLAGILEIEKKMGRTRNEKWEPRIIDIDILLWGDLIIMNENLTIPHPGIPNRRFTLLPMDELIPDLIHPVTNNTIRQMLQDCSDELSVEKI